MNYTVEAGVITLGPPESELDSLRQRALSLGPWRKGPFRVGGLLIEGHWKSDLKWNRAIRAAGDIRGKTVIDVGCNNGYYLFRMREAGASHAIGFDPVAQFENQFLFLNEFARDPSIDFIRSGYQEMGAATADIVFCMGVIYHQKNPMDVLEKLLGALRPGGRIILETMGLDIGENCLVPSGRYAGSSGIWFVPGPGAVANWCKRTGLKCTLADVWDARDEQQKTQFAELPLTTDFYHGEKTSEGYPLPLRYLFHVER